MTIYAHHPDAGTFALPCRTVSHARAWLEDDDNRGALWAATAEDIDERTLIYDETIPGTAWQILSAPAPADEPPGWADGEWL